MAKIIIPRGKLAMVKRFAKARLSAAQYNRGPDELFRPCWWPRLAGRNVRPDGGPENGYDTREQAIDGARQYRDSCRRALSEHRAR